MGDNVENIYCDGVLFVYKKHENVCPLRTKCIKFKENSDKGNIRVIQAPYKIRFRSCEFYEEKNG